MNQDEQRLSRKTNEDRINPLNQRILFQHNHGVSFHPSFTRRTFPRSRPFIKCQLGMMKRFLKKASKVRVRRFFTLSTLPATVFSALFIELIPGVCWQNINTL